MRRELNGGGVVWVRRGFVVLGAVGWGFYGSDVRIAGHWILVKTRRSGWKRRE